jgi:hypothetical protein
MNDLVSVTSSLIATGNRSSWAAAIAVLKAVSVTMRNSAMYQQQFNEAADWIDSQLDTARSKMDQPLWIDLADAVSKYSNDECLLYETILSRIADKVEARGQKGLDLDPGETSDWLREQAKLSALKS